MGMNYRTRRSWRTAWGAILVVALFSACGKKDTITRAEKAAGTSKPSVEQTKNIIEEAFIYGFPLIVNYKVMWDYNIDHSSGQFKAPFNQIYSDAQVYTYKDTAVQTPNSDTPYSLLQADLRAEPIVICVPAIEKRRYYDVQMVDMYTFNYGYLGSRTTGNDAGCYMVAWQTWTGEVPASIKKSFRCESPFSVVIFRTQLFNPGDIDNVKKIQAGYRALPLSAYLHKPAPPPEPAINWPAANSKAIFTTEFPAMLDFLLQFLPPIGPAEVEKPLREKFASIGIGPGKKFEFKDLSAEHMAAVAVALKEGFDKIEKAANDVGKNVNGWQIGAAAGPRSFYNGNWLLRAVGAKVGIYGNDAAEATYPFAKRDNDGNVLDGSKHNYSLTFGAGELPPVNAFWSITMYDAKTQLLIENPINRYLINSPMLPSLKKNGDGSISLYIQKDSPGKDKESNWLPAPDGEIFMVMRLYWPRETPPSVLPPGEGTWKPPTVTVSR